ncbi:ABC transporter, permease protein [hydrothermal vent metagenome]|uniref:ABC transporter, permease protein n=1 Tax=hydrothermal vent metagenome TaxID=652676 RepID=A0A1W1CC36_9ZZZZ
MPNRSTFFYFLTLLLFKQRVKHIGIISISIVIISLLSSVLFVSSSLQESIKTALSNQPDFIVSRVEAGRAVDTPMEWIDKIEQIDGISSIAPRVYGRYLYEAGGRESFLVVGVDFFDEQNHKAVEKIIKDIDIKKFLSTDSMLVGEGVKRFLESRFYKDKFSFKIPDGSFKDVKIYATIPKDSNLISNDMVIMPIDLAREIFGISDELSTDITLSVPNGAEWDTILSKIHLLFYDVRVTDKREMRKAYDSLYNYKGGLFLVLYLITIVTFMLIIYQRYSMVLSSEKREIGILRAIGWSIGDVLKLKFYETLVIIIISLVLGVSIAYIYVFIFDAPIVRNIFLGSENLSNSISFMPVVDMGVLSSIALLYAVPLLVAVLIPVWKIAVTSPKEAML